MPSSSLAEKVRAVLATDTPTGFTGPWDACDSEPGGPRDLSDFECDMRHWGLTYGLAYGIARGEDPYEPNHQVAERALAAARLVWEGWPHKLEAGRALADPPRSPS